MASGSVLHLSRRQLHETAGRSYDWFILQRTGEGTRDLDEDETREKPRSPGHASRVRAVILEISRLPTFLAGEGMRLSVEAHERLVDTIEPDFVAALSLLRRRAEGDYRPDTHREKFPHAAAAVSHPHAHLSAKVKLTGWNAWEAFEAWVRERQPQASTINRWRAVFDHLNKHVDGRDVALITDEDAVAWKDKLMAGEVSGRTVNEVWLTAARRVFNWMKDQKRIAAKAIALWKSGRNITFHMARELIE